MWEGALLLNFSQLTTSLSPFLCSSLPALSFLHPYIFPLLSLFDHRLSCRSIDPTRERGSSRLHLTPELLGGGFPPHFTFEPLQLLLSFDFIPFPSLLVSIKNWVTCTKIWHSNDERGRIVKVFRRAHQNERRKEKEKCFRIKEIQSKKSDQSFVVCTSSKSEILIQYKLSFPFLPSLLRLFFISSKRRKWKREFLNCVNCVEN